MANDNPAKPRMSLYANLLSQPSKESSAPGTISSAPVVYNQPGASDKPEDIIAAAKSKLNAAALRFQPTKRPQVASQKAKGLGPKPIPPATAQANAASAVAAAPPAAPATQTATESSTDQTSGPGRQVTKTTIDDWAVDADEDDYYLEQKRQNQQRGGRKKRKKNKGQQHQPVNWDDIYDPSRPNNYDEYKNSEESIREIRDWKDRLYAHRMARQRSSLSDSEDETPRPRLSSNFAPPGMSFAPLSNLNDDSVPPPPQSPPAVPSSVPDTASGEDAYQQRMRLSQQTQGLPVPAPPAIPPPPPSIPEPQNRSNHPQPDISRAPVRYNLPAAPADIPTTEAELEDALQQEEEATYGQETEATQPEEGQLRSLRPGQKGFAERLMNKYGWTKGSGLGAQGTGITTALRVQVEKAKRKPDAEGGGFVGGSQARGKIIGGKKGADSNTSTSEGKYGAMSEVVVLLGMVDGMDLQTELGEGNLMQEIGEECGEKYGRVERVFIDQSAEGSVPVFIKFTSQLSGLRAVNALEGRVFNGNTIKARFFDKERFDEGNYTMN